mmetsp:Transcript_11836/g.26317  ORF Transcript_11836/g.26317 Transcript_11836/m.26317 type:complete len:479 (-) Transcript_11836:18-1454(-)
MTKRKRSLQGGGSGARHPVSGSGAREPSSTGTRRKVYAKRLHTGVDPQPSKPAAGTSPGAILASVASAASDWGRLEQWLKQGGAQLDALDIRPHGPSIGLGAFAKRDIAAGEVALAVPTSLMLTPQSAVEDSAVAAMAGLLKSCGEADRPELLVSLRLCRAKANAADRFHAYAVSLPETAPGAATWDPAYREVLAKTSLGPTLTACDAELDQWERLLQRLAEVSPGGVLEPISAFARHHLLWARGMLQSRGVSGPEGGTCLWMVPLLDLLNHSNEAEVTINIKGGLLEFSSKRPLKAGTQVWNNYGSKSNSELLMCYGFALADNPHDVLPLRWASSEGSLGKVDVELRRNGIPEAVVDRIEQKQDTAQFVGLLKTLLTLRRTLKQVLAKVPEALNFNVCKGPLARARKASIQDLLEGQLQIVEVCLEEMQTADPTAAELDGDQGDAPMKDSADGSDLDLEEAEEEVLLRRRKKRRRKS